ncbi:MAG: hypothetical protein RB191_24375 [Terriglobia bacterium]|nr:hypothetical protein [Terriglobia bacterium]
MSHVLEMDHNHRYRCVAPEHTTEPCHGVIFSSVTTILGKAVPKDLSWHGQTRGVIGVKGLLRIPKYDVQQMNPGEIKRACEIENIHADAITARKRLATILRYDINTMSSFEITEALKREKLTVNDHRDQAAAGGTVVHKALEDYINLGTLPNAGAVPENKRASIQGLAKFILEFRPEFVASEVRTLSVKHGYAGTFDFLAHIHGELHEVPKRGGGSYVKLRPNPAAKLFILGDMKNSKWVYPTSHFPQLEAYEGARLEIGEPPTDVRAVLWLNADGDMELVPSTASFDDFLALKASADVLGRLDKSYSRPRKART